MAQTRHPISFIATAAPEAAQAFYTDVLGLKLLEASPFALVFADGENRLRVQIVETLLPAPYTVHGWQVANIEDEIKALMSKDVIVEKFDQLAQDALGVWTSPDGHKIAWFKDPSGNILSLTQFADQ